jgi:hypothetical protein
MKSLLLHLGRLLLPRRLHFSTFCPAFLRSRVIKRSQLRVVSGPFQGMQYIVQSFASVFEPKLLGIYERELHKTIEEAVTSGFTKVIDIGAAEGYYAIGLALRLPKAVVWAFEADEQARSLIRLIAERNNVSDRVHAMGLCRTEDLAAIIPGNEKTLIVCDVEGAEATLLNPQTVPGLRNSFLIVEMHTKTAPGIIEILRNRFSGTHHIRTIEQQPRTEFDYPYQSFPVNFFPRAYIENSVSEFRQPWQHWMSWFWMMPKIS